MDYLDINDLLQVFDNIFDASTTKASKQFQKSKTSSYQPQVFGFWCPEVKRATFNGNTTIVWFTDGTYTIVNCSAEDKYDRKTAIAYAIVKRLLGKVGKYDKKTGKTNPKEVDGNGFGCYLQKIVDNAFDQEKEEKLALEKKRAAKSKHEAMQAAQQKAAFDKRVEERAKQILLERAAIDRANEIEDARRQQACDNICQCAKPGPRKNCCKDNSLSILDTYAKPDKPFSKYTPQEKREYWRFQNAKKRAAKK